MMKTMYYFINEIRPIVIKWGTFFLLIFLFGGCKDVKNDINGEITEKWKSPVTGKTYHLIFNDEFESEKGLTDKWAYRGAGWTSPITRKIEFENREYIIASVKEAVKMNDGNMELHVFLKDGINDTIYTGGLSTIHTFRPQYGYFETKVNFTDCMNSWGHWPAFWVMYTFPGEEELPPNNYDIFSQATEIDIFEFISQEEKIFTNLHWRIKDTLSAQPSQIGLHGRKDYSYPLDSAGTGWHILAAEWTPEEIIFYCNGEVKLRRNISENERFVPSAFQYVCFSMSAGTWGGNIADPENNLPATVKFDYCRVYQQSHQKAYYKLPVTGEEWVLLSAEERINDSPLKSSLSSFAHRN